MTNEHLLLFGASVRAAAFSALRAGLRPWCADLFGDADLQARCPALALAKTQNNRRELRMGPILARASKSSELAAVQVQVRYN